MALNQCTFLGRLTREPDIRYVAETQMPIARFTLAVGRGTKKENEADADFITCVAFDKRAEFVEKPAGIWTGSIASPTEYQAGSGKDFRAGNGECRKPGTGSKKCGSSERRRSQAGCITPHKSSRKPDRSRAGRICSQRTRKFHEYPAGCG